MKVEIGNLKAVRDLDVASRIPRVKLNELQFVERPASCNRLSPLES